MSDLEPSLLGDNKYYVKRYAEQKGTEQAPLLLQYVAELFE